MADAKKLLEAAAAAVPPENLTAVGAAVRAALKGVDTSGLASTSAALARAMQTATAGLGDTSATFRAADLLRSSATSQLLGASAVLGQIEDSQASHMASIASQIAKLTESLASDRWLELSSGALAGFGSLDHLIGPEMAALGKAQSFAEMLTAQLPLAPDLPDPGMAPGYRPESFFPRYEVPARPAPRRPRRVHLNADPRCFNAGESDEIVRWLRVWLEANEDGPVRCGCLLDADEYDLIAYRVSVPLWTHDPNDDIVMDRVSFVCGVCDQVRDFVAWPGLRGFRRRLSVLEGEEGGDGGPAGNLHVLPPGESTTPEGP